MIFNVQPQQVSYPKDRTLVRHARDAEVWDTDIYTPSNFSQPSGLGEAASAPLPTVKCSLKYPSEAVAPDAPHPPSRAHRPITKTRL